MSVAGGGQGAGGRVWFCRVQNLKKKKELESSKLTSIVFNIPCKCFGALQVGLVGLDKLRFPWKYVAVKSDDTKEVVGCQVIQDVDQCGACLDGKMVQCFIEERSLVSRGSSSLPAGSSCRAWSHSDR